MLKVRRHLEDLGHGYNEMKTAGTDWTDRFFSLLTPSWQHSWLEAFQTLRQEVMSTEKTRKLFKVTSSQLPRMMKRGDIFAEVQAGTGDDQTGESETVVVTNNCPALKKHEVEHCTMMDITGSYPTVAMILNWAQHANSTRVCTLAAPEQVTLISLQVVRND